MSGRVGQWLTTRRWYLLLWLECRTVRRANAVHPSVSCSLCLADSSACVFIAISILYTRLFVFLRRPDKIRSPYSNSPTSGTYDSERGHRSYVIQRHRRRLSALFRSKKSNDTTKQGQVHGDEIGPKDMSGINHVVPIPLVEVRGEDESRRASDGKKWDGPGEIPPWERLHLPTFEVNGERFGGPSTNVGSGSLWSDWKGLGSRTGDSSKKRASSLPVVAQTSSLPAAMPAAYGTRGSDQSGTSSSTFNSLPPVAGTGTYRGSDPAQLTTIYSSDYHQGESQDPLGRYDQRLPTLVSDHMTPSTSSTNLAEPIPSHPDFQSTPHIRRASENDSSVSSSGLPTGKETTFDDRESEHAREDEEWDLMRVLQSTMPEGAEKERNRSAVSSEEYELVPESMSSYLNRKTSMLMLYFPLAVSLFGRDRVADGQYVLLFSVSLIRLICEWFTPPGNANKVDDFISPNPSTPLRAISRWFVFSQGIVDALIYGVVEWQ